MRFEHKDEISRPRSMWLPKICAECRAPFHKIASNFSPPRWKMSILARSRDGSNIYANKGSLLS